MIPEPCKSSGEKSASAVIFAAPALLTSIDILPPASGNAVLKIYDNPSAASGTLLWEGQVQTAGTSLTVDLSIPVWAGTGIYASLSGTATTYVVRFYATF
jgi:hypothetical protein